MKMPIILAGAATLMLGTVAVAQTTTQQQQWDTQPTATQPTGTTTTTTMDNRQMADEATTWRAGERG